MKPRLLLLLFLVVSIGMLSVHAQDTPTLTPITAANAASVTPLNILGYGLLNDVAWSPNGKTIAVATSTGAILYDADRMDTATPRRFAYSNAGMALVAFSPDGKLLAALSDSTGGYQPEISIWNIEKQQLITSWEFVDSAGALIFSPDGTVLAASSGGEAYLWDLSALPTVSALLEERWLDVQRRWYLPRNIDTSAIQDQDILAYSPLGNLLAVAAGDGTVALWNTASSSRRLTTVPSSKGSLSFSPNGKLLFWTARAEGGYTEVHIWDIDRREEAFGGAHILNAFAFHPFESKMLFATSTGNVWVWDDRSRLQRIILGYEQQIARQTAYSVAFAPNRPVLAVARMNQIELWDVASGAKQAVVTANPSDSDILNVIVFSPDGSLMVTAGEDGFVRIWDAFALHQLAAIQHDSVVYDVTFSPDGRLLATYSPVFDSDSNLGQEAVFLWRISTIVSTTEVIAAKDAAARIYHTNYVGDIYSVRFSPDGKKLALTGNGIEIWNVAKVLNRGLNADSDEQFYEAWTSTIDDGAGPLAWSSDGQTLATGLNGTLDDQNCSFVLWSVDRSVCMLGDDGPVTSLVFNPAGDVVASSTRSDGGFDNTVRLWNVQTGEPLNIFYHYEEVWTVAFSPDGKWLASGSGGCYQCSGEGYSIDGVVRLWGVRS